jgi:hypothetical protein
MMSQASSCQQASACRKLHTTLMLDLAVGRVVSSVAGAAKTSEKNANNVVAKWHAQ